MNRAGCFSQKEAARALTNLPQMNLMKQSSTLAVVAVVAAMVALPSAADPALSNTPAGKMLLLDHFGRAVQVSTNEMPAGFIPPPAVGLERQIPAPVQGTSQPNEIQQRGRDAAIGFRSLPSVPPVLQPYLASQDEYGNTAARPGPLFPAYPLESLVQGPKYWLSEHGLRYSLEQTINYVNMTGVQEGDNTLGFYTLEFKGVWAMYDSPASGTAGWISSQFDVKTGIGSPGQSQDAKRNLGTITDPTDIWSDVNGLRVPELAWQQAAFDGRLVAVAGVVNQGNYIDQNAYAQSGRGQFMNSALIDTRVMPIPQYNFGFNLQWQPLNEYYAMFGASAGNNDAGFAPWTKFSLSTWSMLWELGYAPKDVLGLGPGIYRIQPFLAEVENQSGGGLCFDLQQKLGPRTPFGWYGRFGFGSEAVSAGAAAQVGTGFVMQGPLDHVLLRRRSNDLLGVGFVWSQPSATSKTVYHQNEYILEAFYALQFSPTVRFQPDFQFVTNPAFNRDHDHALVFQLQLILTW